MGLFNIDIGSLRKAVSDLAGQVRALRARIEQAKRKREDIQSAPVNKSDIKSLITAWARHKAVGYQKDLEAHLRPLFNAPQGCQQRDCRTVELSVLGVTGHREGLANPASMDGALALLLGPQAMAAALCSVVDSMDIPDQGPTFEQRQAMLKALDDEISQLQAEEQELMQAARAAGIVIE